MITETTMKKTNHYFLRILALLAALAIAVSSLVEGARPAQAAFPGQNGKIAFTSNQEGNNFEIYTMNPDGSGQKRLTFNSAFDFDPAVSPDGKQIAFVSDRADDADVGDTDIFVMNSDGSGAPLLLDDRDSFDTEPAWSPDGKKIAFTSNRNGDRDIFVKNADGTGTAFSLTNSTADDSAPAFSPDGTKIAFVSGRDSKKDSNGILIPNSEIYVMEANGTNQTRLTNDPAEDTAPSFSSNGAKIAFQSDRDGNENIYKMNADGSSQKRLTKNAAFDSLPAFSPNGKKITFVSDRDGEAEVFVMNAKDGSRQKNLTDNAAADTQPDWGVAAQQ